MPSEGNVAAARAVIRQERANGEPVALPPADPTAEW